MFSPEVRRRKIISFVIWGLINLAIAIFIAYLIARYWKHWSHGSCIGELSFWLIGYLVIHVAHLIRKVFLIFFWWKAKDPTIQEVQFNIFFGILVFLPEIGWYIYGNTFIYDSAEKECRTLHPEVETLWRLSLLLIIYGYLLMLMLLGIIIFGIGAYCLYRSWGNLE